MSQKTKALIKRPSSSKPVISAALGKLIRERRIQAGLTEAEVAKYLGVSPLVLTAYESGARAIPMHQIYALSNRLNISPAEISRIFTKTSQKMT